MSLDRAAVVRRYKQLLVEMGLPAKDVVLNAGAALVLLGLRKYANDIDVSVPEAFFNQQRLRKGTLNGLTGPMVAWDGLVDIYPLPTHFTEAHVMDHLGVWVFHPNALIKQKRRTAKHKDRDPMKAAQDRADIVKLKEFMDNVTHAKTQLDKAGVTLLATKV